MFAVETNNKSGYILTIHKHIVLHSAVTVKSVLLIA